MRGDFFRVRDITAMTTSLTLLASRGTISPGPGPEFHFGGKSHRGALLVSPGGTYDWNAAGASLDEQSLLAFLDAQNGPACDFLLIGTGPKHRLLPPALVESIGRRGLGLEAMDTAAACRTYNILMAENRQFMAGLLPL
jgi:uncharacterized protein